MRSSVSNDQQQIKICLTFTELQQEQPQLYGSLTTNLTPDEQAIVQTAVHQAETNATLAAQAALAANGTA